MEQQKDQPELAPIRDRYIGLDNLYAWIELPDGREIAVEMVQGDIFESDVEALGAIFDYSSIKEIKKRWSSKSISDALDVVKCMESSFTNNDIPFGTVFCTPSYATGSTIQNILFVADTIREGSVEMDLYNRAKLLRKSFLRQSERNGIKTISIPVLYQSSKDWIQGGRPQNMVRLNDMHMHRAMLAGIQEYFAIYSNKDTQLQKIRIVWSHQLKDQEYYRRILRGSI